MFADMRELSPSLISKACVGRKPGPGNPIPARSRDGSLLPYNENSISASILDWAFGML
jgi:hypothetical protein